MVSEALYDQIEQLVLPNGIKLTYQHYGQSYRTAPIVLINHPLTGNSNVAGSSGWWNELIGTGKTISTEKYAVIVFNIPGNGYDGTLIDNYETWNTGVIAELFYDGLKQLLGINQLYAVIGGSIGAGIGWEMVAKFPNFVEHFISVGGDWKSTDWMIANTFLQKQILESNPKPIEIARMQAMLCYRTPKALKLRFNRSKNEELGLYNVESWLSHHGDKLANRFDLSAYKMMNHLLGTIDITREGASFEELIITIESKIHIFSIDSDLFFPLSEDLETVERAKKVGVKIKHRVIKSDYGHDAFLIEFEKLQPLLEPIFN